MTRLLASLTLALAVAGVVAGGAPQEPTYRGTSGLVRVFATVTDRSGKLVTTLAKEQFEVKDDGKSQPIVVFDNSPQPIQLIVLLDCSGSMSGNLGLLRTGATELFRALGEQDVARVGTFGKDIVISKEWTRDPDKLEAALPEFIPKSAPTPLWRAVDQAMSAFDRQSDRRPVVLVLTDGKDADMRFSWRVVSQADVIDRARAEDVMVYGVGMRSRNAAQPGAPPMGPSRGPISVGPGGITIGNLNADEPDPGLAKTAEETGGGYVEIRPYQNLGAAFTEIARELHSQYLIGYAPPKRDGKTHKIDVHVMGGGLTPRARRSYVAPKGDYRPRTAAGSP